MKKTAAILCIFCQLLTTSGINDLFKLQSFFQHFYETNQTGKPVGVVDFLVMHYITDDLNDKDNKQDQELPFKSTDSFTTIYPVLYFPIQDMARIDYCLFPGKEKDLLKEKELQLITNFNSNIWHPPKNA